MKTQNLRLNVQPLANYVCKVQFAWQASELKKQNQNKPQTIFTHLWTQWILPWNGTGNPRRALVCFQPASFHLKIVQFPEKNQVHYLCDLKIVKYLKYLCLSVRQLSCIIAMCIAIYEYSYSSIPYLYMGEDLKYRSSLQLLCTAFQELHLKNYVKLAFTFHLGFSLQFQPLAGSSSHFYNISPPCSNVL